LPPKKEIKLRFFLFFLRKKEKEKSAEKEKELPSSPSQRSGEIYSGGRRLRRLQCILVCVVPL
jgi:hypothetical protein